MITITLPGGTTIQIDDAAVLAGLKRVEDAVSLNSQRQEAAMSKLDDLAAQVAENTTVEGSAVQLIQNIAAQLAAAGTDPAKLDALSAQLKTSADALAAAVAANTAPPAPAP